MNHDELREKIMKAVGGRPPIGMRETWSSFLKNRENRFFIRDDWIRDHRFTSWAFNHPDLEVSPRDDGFTVEIIGFGRMR